MRKRILTASETQRLNGLNADAEWLALESLATVEMTSEDPCYPIEGALLPGSQNGWRAATAGPQTIRLLFDRPRPLRRIDLEFDAGDEQRTQEYVLRWSGEDRLSSHEIVRQQWNFGPSGAMSEREDHHVELSAVCVLELIVTPDISGGDARASLTRMRLA